jgi:hypothetical protein
MKMLLEVTSMLLGIVLVVLVSGVIVAGQVVSLFWKPTEE